MYTMNIMCLGLKLLSPQISSSAEILLLGALLLKTFSFVSTLGGKAFS